MDELLENKLQTYRNNEIEVKECFPIHNTRRSLPFLLLPLLLLF